MQKVKVCGVERTLLKFDDGKSISGFYIHLVEDIYDDKGKGQKALKPEFLSDDKYPIVCKVDNPYDLIGKNVDINYDRFTKVRELKVVA